MKLLSCLLVPLTCLLLETSTRAADDVYLTIDYFPIGSSSSPPINAVLHASKSAVECAQNNHGEQACTAEWLAYIDKCWDWFHNTNSSGLFVSRTSKFGDSAVVTYRFEGGSGGDHISWELFPVNAEDRNYSRCPSEDRSMSGIEVNAGGNVWYEGSCKKDEPFEDCAERWFYPKSKAARLEFSSSGVRFTKVPSKPKIPRSFIDEPYGQ